jgi:lysophospholipase L1-like esterase
MLPRFFKANVAVANHAESGETIKSFLSGLRFAKVLSQIKEGDYLLIQFGHNDEKKNWPQTYVEAHTTYKAYLNVFIAEAKLRRVTPVLVTSMQRRVFDETGRIRNTHGDYPEAVREVGKEEGVAVIDLDLASRAFYEALGPKDSPLAFSNDGKDPTHHNNYGGYELAKVIVQGLRDAKIPLAMSIVDTFTGFDPAKPDPVRTFNVAASPQRSDAKLRGN